ncbi:MAG: EamA family transporter, partial [Patescibacteria group bacterium]
KKILNKGTEISLILAGRHLYGGIMLIIFTLLINRSVVSSFNINNLITASYLGLYLSLLAFLWYSSIKKVPVSVASSFLPLTAVVSLFGSAFFLKETISFQQYLGFFFIVGGMIWLANLPIHKKA